MNYDEAMIWMALGAGTLLLITGLVMWLFEKFACDWIEKYDKGHK